MDGTRLARSDLRAGQDLQRRQIPPLRRFKFIAPGLLKTMGNRLVAGRDFAWEDLYDKRPVALVSENLARELWGSPAAALGKRIRENIEATWREVVGVVGDERDDGVDKKAPTIVYWPMLMANFEGDDESVRRAPAFMIRSTARGHERVRQRGQPRGLVGQSGSAARQRPHAARDLRSSLARTSFTLVMLAIAGGMALLLGVAGIYGVISYSVSQRIARDRHPHGARRAAPGGHAPVRRPGAAAWRSIGIALGLAAALALTRLIKSLLFDVNAVDPLTYARCVAGSAGGRAAGELRAGASRRDRQSG